MTASSRASTGWSTRSRCRARSSSCTTRSTTRRGPYAEKYADVDPRVVPTLNTLGRGPAFAIRAGIEAAPGARRRGHDGRRLRRSDAGRRARPPDRARVAVVAAASRYMPGGAQIGAPWLKSTFSRWAGLTLCWFARVGTHDATSSFKAYDRAFVQQVGIESDAGFELAIELVAKARRHRRPLARSRRSGSSARRASRTSRCGSGCRATSTGTSTHSDRGE